MAVTNETKTPVLLTASDLLAMETMTPKLREVFLRERGLIAPEPVDPLLIEAREVAARNTSWRNYPVEAQNCREGLYDRGDYVSLALAALRRGMELGRSDCCEALAKPELTREMVEKAYRSVWGRYNSNDQAITALHAAITEGQSK